MNVVGGGTDQDWAVVELEANAVCKNGKYGLSLPLKTIGLGTENGNCRDAVSATVRLGDAV